ncbi:hypothetical protein AC579_7523 [Pseudocercospora musae]|uniref:Uncharacterized protein n=1 Tax=Pseudocercospora musae TaxID=113226 RepID=A0A139I778_9PEZI|nr:hypothetical protein AC579_7523 [Pseudocercospora musae]
MSQNTKQVYPDMENAFATINQDWNGSYWVQNAFDLDFTAAPAPQPPRSSLAQMSPLSHQVVSLLRSCNAAYASRTTLRPPLRVGTLHAYPSGSGIQLAKYVVAPFDVVIR